MESPWKCKMSELLVVGERLDAPAFENAVMDKLLWTYRESS
jgi:hypothetical protein